VLIVRSSVDRDGVPESEVEVKSERPVAQLRRAGSPDRKESRRVGPKVDEPEKRVADAQGRSQHEEVLLPIPLQELIRSGKGKVAPGLDHLDRPTPDQQGCPQREVIGDQEVVACEET